MSLIRPRAGNSTTGFTLVELLVVLGIIAVLAMILVPLASRMIDSAGTAKTVNNLKSIMSTSFAYAADNNGFYLPIRIDVQTWPQTPVPGTPAIPNALNRWCTHPKVLQYFGIQTNEMAGAIPREWMPVAKAGRRVKVLNGGQTYTDGRNTIGINKTDLVFSPAPALGNSGRMGFRTTEIQNPNRLIAFAESNDWMVAHTENGKNLIDHWEQKYDQGEANPSVAAPAFRNNGKVCVVTYSGSVQQLTRDEAREWDRWSIRTN